MSKAAKAVGGGALIAIALLGFLYLRLMFGPIALNFLAGPIEGAIAEELAGPRVRIDGVALSLNDRGLVQFELKNVKVSDTRGETLVAAPSVAVSLSGHALLRGRIAVESLDLISARLVFFYADDGALSLKFSPGAAAEAAQPGPQAGPARQPGAAQPAPAASPAQEPEGAIGRIDLVKVLTEASARARRQEHATAYLREIGLRAATVVIDNGRQQTVWQVPELDVDLDHRRSRSSIAGRAKVDSKEGPWELAFRSHERVSAKVLNLTLSVHGLVPRGLASAFPKLLALEAFDLPISADIEVELSNAGDILGGKIAIEAADGSVALPGQATPMRIAGGHIELTYNGAARTFEIGPSELSSAEGRVRFTGAIAYAAQGADGPRWRFDMKSTEGWIAADPKAPMRLPVDQLTATGFLDPEQGRIVVDQVLVRAGGTEVSAQGELSDIGGVIAARLDGKIGAMSVGLLKTLWPSWLAPHTRTWISRRLVGGDVNGGSFKLVRGAGKSSGGWTPVSDSDRLIFTLEGADLDFALLEGVPALHAPRALLTIEGTSVEFSMPEATIASADGRKFSLKSTFAVDLSQPQPRQGQLAIKGSGPLSLAIDLMEQQAPHLLQNAGVTLAGADGKIEGTVTIGMPLVPDMQLRDIAVDGKVRVSDARVPQALGPHDVQGINLAVDLSPGAFEAKGKFLVGNVPATLTWQHVYGAAPEKQPPLRIAAVLYEAERNELGLDIDDIVHGEVGVEVSVAQDAKGQPQVHLRADLANAELVLEALGWSKPVGRRAVFEFDVAKGTAYPIELRNVRLEGENVAVAGWMGLGQDLHIKEYRYPQFSLDVVSNFEAHGKLRSDNVWEVTAKGPTYDGRDLFKSFFFVPTERHKDHHGLDLRAEFDTVLGYFETSARNVRLTMQKRANKLNQLDMRASLAGGKQLEAVVRPEPGRPRLLIAKSNDAGQAFKLVGFLPHAVGGDLNLEVNIEGKGAAERTGTLMATRFYLLGDAICVEAPTSGGRCRNVAREKFEFDTLRAPFSVGSGQFVLNNASIESQLMSATMSGRVDFRTRKVRLTGTFTPLAAVNKMFSDVPIFGDLIAGPKREGVFAWNFGVQGGLENPQIVVNPISGLAPGFTREAFPIIPEEPPSTPPRKGGTRPDAGARSSSSPVTRPGAPDSLFPTAPDVSDGWISEPAKSGAGRK
ncbi:MAG TPA: AsmA-like C-terminal region-containing protein [Hyphomicrobiaceae bacterium]